MSNPAEPEIIMVDFASDEMKSLTDAQRQEQRKADPLGSGFVWYTPPMAAERTDHLTGGHHWIISGHDMQVLTTTVPAGETIVAEVGSFFFGSANIKTNVEFTCCSGGEGCNRICGGESCVKVLLTNEDNAEGYVGLTPNFPAKVIPIQFGKHVRADHMLIAKPGAYMAQLGDVNVSCDLDCSCVTCCCAGLGCCRQKLTGSKDSIAFLAAGGTLVYRQLEEGETIIVDTHSIVAMEQTVKLGITPNGRCGMCCFGGEGCFSSTLTGPGKVFLQSMSFGRFQAAVQQTIDDRGDGGADAGM